MQLGQYHLNIIGKGEQGGYIHMRHGEEYSISMRNQSGKRTEAEVRIDGEHVGTWRLSPYQTVAIERPADVAKKFAFYASDSVEGHMVGAESVAALNRGVVSVVFYPEKEVEKVYRQPAVYRSYAPPAQTFDSYASGTLSYGGNMRSAEPIAKNVASGVTGLTGHSNQQFNTVAALVRDHANAVTIELRLVVDKQVADPQPLTSRRLKISAPPPID